jgi:TonB family protein
MPVVNHPFLGSWAGRLATTGAFWLTLSAAPQNVSPPTLNRQIQPEWGPELAKEYSLETVQVEMVVDTKGFPFSLSATSGLPDNVVQALAQWRFQPGKKDGKDEAFKVTYNIAIRNAWTAATVRATRRRWFPPTRELDEAIRRGYSLDASELPALMQTLEASPQDASARATLLSYASTRQQDTQPEEAAKTRTALLSSLIENQPSAPVLGSPLATITSVLPSSDASTREQVRALWLPQLAQKPSDSVTLGYATNYLRLDDPSKTEAALLPMIGRVASAAIWLGDLYGLSAMGVIAVDPKTGLPSVAGNHLPDDSFAQKARFALTNATDPHVVFSGLAVVVTGGRSLSKSGQLPAEFPDLCNDVLKHAKELYSGLAYTCDTSTDDLITREQIERIRVGGNVLAATRIKSATPAYPKDAKARGIQGKVSFSAVIDKQGKIKSLVLLSGPLVLYESARDAVLRWEYKPAQLDGKPVEVITTLDVNYSLSGR